MTRTLMAALMMFVAANSVHAQTILLVPASGNNRVSAFSAFDGSIIDLDFIADDAVFADDGTEITASTLDTPINAIASGRGTIFVSDQDEGVFEYDFNGNLIGNVAGPTQGIGQVQGIETRGDSLFANSAEGADSVQEFNLVTGAQSTWTTTNLNGINDILFRENDVLISNFFSDNIERYDLDGNFLSTFVDGDPDDGIDFPLQIHEASNGDILAAGLSTPGGIYRYDSDDGTLIEFIDVGSVRGVHELENGNLLFSSAGLGVVVLDLETGAQTEITRGVEIGTWRSIEAVTIAVPEPSGVLLVTIVALPAMLVRRKRQMFRQR